MNKLLPGWRPVGGPGLSGSVTCGWNGLLEGRVLLCWAQIKSLWKIIGENRWCLQQLEMAPLPPSGARPCWGWVLAYLEKCCCSVTICRLPRRDVAPSLLSTPRCRLTSSCRLVRSWISVVGGAAGKDNSFPVNPTGWNPSEGLQGCRTSVQSFCLLSWTEDHRQAFNLAWHSWRVGFWSICSCHLMQSPCPASMTSWDSECLICSHWSAKTCVSGKGGVSATGWELMLMT